MKLHAARVVNIEYSNTKLRGLRGSVCSMVKKSYEDVDVLWSVAVSTHTMHPSSARAARSTSCCIEKIL